MAARAMRFAGNAMVAVTEFINDTIQEELRVYQEALERYYEEERLIAQYEDWDRVKFLMERDGLSLLEACQAIDEEERKWREDTFAWLNDPANFDSEIYSDVYKGLYGVRPHGYRPC